jgi:aspartate kinase
MDDADEAAKIIEGCMQCESVDVNKEVSKVSIVGAGMQTNAGVAAKMFEALYDANINIRMISTSEIRVTVLIDAKNTERAMNAIHDKFDLGDK